MRWRTGLVLIGALLISLAGCQPGPAGDESASPTVESTESAPDGPGASPTASNSTPGERPVYYLIDANGERIAGQIGSWCWADACVDLEAPPHPEVFALVVGGTITLALDPPVPEEMALSLRPAQGAGAQAAAEEIAPDSLEIAWTPDAPPGEYVLTAHGSYDGGASDLSYYFGVTLAADGESGLPAPPRLDLTVGAESLVEGLLGSYCWPQQPENGQQVSICVDTIWPPVHETYTPLPGGEPIRLQFADHPPAALVMNLYDAPALYADSATQPLATFTVDPVQEPVEWSPEAPRGDYILAVFATWPNQADASYSFAIQIP